MIVAVGVLLARAVARSVGAAALAAHAAVVDPGARAVVLVVVWPAAELVAGLPAGEQAVADLGIEPAALHRKVALPPHLSPQLYRLATASNQRALPLLR